MSRGAGVLTTASDVAFTGGREGYFVALDARRGDLLWKVSLGGQINSGPMTTRRTEAVRDRRCRQFIVCLCAEVTSAAARRIPQSWY